MTRLEQSAEIRALIGAGDEMAQMLRDAPGIDPFRSHTLDGWKDAKRRLNDPYGAHLRDVVEGRK